ncbi:hypothetical protein Tco_0669356 [Tanacetum coccineum]
MGRDTIQLDDAVSTISREYLLEFTSEYGIQEDLHPELPGPEDTIVDFQEGKVEIDLFNLISAPNPAKVKTRTRPRVAHKVPLLTAMTNRVIDIDTTGGSGSFGTPSTVEKSPLDFADEDLPPPNTEGVGTEEQIKDELSREIPPVGYVTTAKVVPETGKSLAIMGLGASSISSTPSAHGAPTTAKSVSDPDPLSYAKPQPYPNQGIAQSSRGTATEIPTEHVATTEVNVQLSMGSPEPPWVIDHSIRLAVGKCAEFDGTRQRIRDLVPELLPTKRFPMNPELRFPKIQGRKEEMLLEDAIAANISRAEKKKKCRVVCRTHGIGSAHHARSDGIPVSVPTVAPQGLAILLVDAATQTEVSEGEASPRLLRSKSLPPMYNLDWP